ncbi:DUF406 family protein [Paraferrimonas sedimenticola]|uniref:Uncharacterized protein n=1 Tax=Paraferrimonas sedimenticola TaxID=375674 RepID=A0AA37RYN6_9GAMM|nr:DUF406 family protein [Paraferrimonas sedimenticola]GLP97875.1 hypothetical protein GCM10007895_31820 [Paraferrimonas sedimenticola]
MSEKNPLDQVVDACNNVVEIGTVIDESDTALSITFGDDTPENQAAREAATQAITKRFPKATVAAETQNGQLLLAVTFDCAAEKLIYQMEQR